MIIRREKKTHYATVANTVIDDERLSYEALGLLTYLLSRPDDWEVHIDQLRARKKLGRDKIYRIVRELKDAGYMEHERVYEDGRVKFGRWIVREEPNPKGEQNSTESATGDLHPENPDEASVPGSDLRPENLHPAIADSGKPARILKTERYQALKDTNEREIAGARPEMSNRAAERLAALKAKHPSIAADSQTAIDAAWVKLTGKERDDAFDRYDEWLANVRGLRRPVCGLDKYLGEKRWILLPTRGVNYVVIGMFEKRWFAVIAQRILAGEVGRLGFFARQQQDSKGWSVTETDIAALDAVHLVQLEAQSPEADAWWAWIAENGIRLPRPDRIPFVWFPWLRPPGHGPRSSYADAKAGEHVV